MFIHISGWCVCVNVVNVEITLVEFFKIMQLEEVDTEIPVPMVPPVEYELVEEEPMPKHTGQAESNRKKATARRGQ